MSVLKPPSRNKIAMSVLKPHFRNKMAMSVVKPPLEMEWTCLFNINASRNSGHICLNTPFKNNIFTY